MPRSVTVLFCLLEFCIFYVADSLRPTGLNGLHRSPGGLQELLSSAAEVALEHCQGSFRWDRWNCPSSVFSSSSRALPPNRETAFVSAVTAAAIVHVVARNCSRGQLVGCGCLQGMQGGGGEDWVWGGCSDNVDHGDVVSKKALDDLEKGMDAQTYTNLHNYGVGRETVRRSMARQCKCHGLSGSCTVRSCWMRQAPFNEVARKLRQAYDRAVRVDFEGESSGVRVVVGNSVAGHTVAGMPQASYRDLVYHLPSPDYCQPNNSTGWRGTRGRTCSRVKGEGASEGERKSCKALCRQCGHQVRKRRRTVVKHCRCSFKWCCSVVCESCREVVQQHYCS